MCCWSSLAGSADSSFRRAGGGRYICEPGAQQRRSVGPRHPTTTSAVDTGRLTVGLGARPTLYRSRSPHCSAERGPRALSVPRSRPAAGRVDATDSHPQPTAYSPLASSRRPAAPLKEGAPLLGVAAIQSPRAAPPAQTLHQHRGRSASGLPCGLRPLAQSKPIVSNDGTIALGTAKVNCTYRKPQKQWTTTHPPTVGVVIDSQIPVCARRRRVTSASFAPRSLLNWALLLFELLLRRSLHRTPPIPARLVPTLAVAGVVIVL